MSLSPVPSEKLPSPSISIIEAKRSTNFRLALK